ncbi:hypothetical protein ABK040_001429 [Willaertia magna]
MSKLLSSLLLICILSYTTIYCQVAYNTGAGYGGGGALQGASIAGADLSRLNTDTTAYKDKVSQLIFVPFNGYQNAYQNPSYGAYGAPGINGYYGNPGYNSYAAYNPAGYTYGNAYGNPSFGVNSYYPAYGGYPGAIAPYGGYAGAPYGAGFGGGPIGGGYGAYPGYGYGAGYPTAAFASAYPTGVVKVNDASVPPTAAAARVNSAAAPNTAAKAW